MARVVRDEAEAFEVFGAQASNEQVYEAQIQNFVSPVVQGLNLAVMAVGASGSGKSFTLNGSASEFGVIHYFVEGLFNTLNNTLENEPGVAIKHTLRMQFIEIVNEEITDLLTKSKRPVTIEPDEWETVAIQGADRRIIGSAEQFAELHSMAVQNKTSASTEFGNLSHKAATILTLDLIQTIESSTDVQVLVSKLTFVECPGIEVLAQSPETVRLSQGPTLNQAVLALQDVVGDVAMGKNVNASSEASVFTRALSEVLGGNTIGIAVFNFQCDDHQGSGANIKLLKQFQRIVNFPIANDNRAICLLHKYRRESINLRKIIYGAGGETVEEYQSKIAELEKKLISANVGSMKYEEEVKKMGAKLVELKEMYNSMVRQKADVQTQLLDAEEQKLSLTKGLIDLQIKNSQLKEELEKAKYEQDSKGLRKDANLHLLQSSRDKAQKTILDLQESLDKATKQKHEFELELATVRKNYLNKCREVEEMRKKNEQIGLEFIGAINENKSMMGASHIGSKDSFEVYGRKIIRMEAESQRLREELARAAAEIEKMHSEKIKNEVIVEQVKVDFEKKRTALEKEYVARARNRDIDLEKNMDVNAVKEGDKNAWEDERLDLANRVKELYRRLEVANAELSDAINLNEELKVQKSSLEVQLNELADTCRNKLVDMSEDESRKELLKTFRDKEIVLKEEVEVARRKLDRLRSKCKTLREYSRQLRYLCEDIYPEDKVRPDILLEEPPFIINEEQEILPDSLKPDLRRLQEENYSLKLTIDDLREKLKKSGIVKSSPENESMIRQKIMQELNMLKSKPNSRPSSSTEELERIRKERNRVLEENVRLKQIVTVCITVR